MLVCAGARKAPKDPPSDERQASDSSMKQTSVKMEREARWQVFALRAQFVKSRGCVPHMK